MSPEPAPLRALLSPLRDENAFLSVSYFSAPFLGKLTALLEAHYADERFSACDMSRLLCLCSMQAYRKVKKHTGFSPGHYILHFRLAKALHLLRNTDLSICEIAWQTGFMSQSYFARAFRKVYGAPPRFMR